MTRLHKENGMVMVERRDLDRKTTTTTNIVIFIFITTAWRIYWSSVEKTINGQVTSIGVDLAEYWVIFIFRWMIKTRQMNRGEEIDIPLCTGNLPSNLSSWIFDATQTTTPYPIRRVLCDHIDIDPIAKQWHSLATKGSFYNTPFLLIHRAANHLEQNKTTKTQNQKPKTISFLGGTETKRNK